MLNLEIAGIICGAIAVSVFLVWTVFQCADKEAIIEEPQNAATPLIRKNNSGSFSQNTSNKDNSNIRNPNGTTKQNNPPAAIPKFTNRVEATGSNSITFTEKSILFCKCGGGSPVIKLLPCEHSSLCLHCAQLEKTCPTCGTVIKDSIPSFRDISV